MEDVTVPSPSLARKCDDSSTLKFDWRLVGAIPVLHRGFTPELSPCARNAEGSHPPPCRQNLVASGDRTRCPFHGCHHRAVVLHGAAPTRRPRGGPAPGPPQGLRQGNPLRRRRGATHAPVPRVPTLELP